MTVRCEMMIDVPAHSNLQDFTEFMQSVNRVKQYTYDVIGSFVDPEDVKGYVNFQKVSNLSVENIHHIANLNCLYFTEIHKDEQENELTYLLTSYKNNRVFNCYLEMY